MLLSFQVSRKEKTVACEERAWSKRALVFVICVGDGSEDER